MFFVPPSAIRFLPILAKMGAFGGSANSLSNTTYLGLYICPTGITCSFSFIVDSVLLIWYSKHLQQRASHQRRVCPDGWRFQSRHLLYQAGPYPHLDIRVPCRSGHFEFALGLGEGWQ